MRQEGGGTDRSQVKRLAKTSKNIFKVWKVFVCVGHVLLDTLQSNRSYAFILWLPEFLDFSFENLTCWKISPVHSPSIHTF